MDVRSVLPGLLWKTLAPSWGSPEALNQQSKRPKSLVNLASEASPRGPPSQATRVPDQWG